MGAHWALAGATDKYMTANGPDTGRQLCGGGPTAGLAHGAAEEGGGGLKGQVWTRH